MRASFILAITSFVTPIAFDTACMETDLEVAFVVQTVSSRSVCEKTERQIDMEKGLVV